MSSARLARWISQILVLALVVTGVPAVARAASGQASHNSHVLPDGNGSWKPGPAPKPQPFAWKPPKGKGAPLVKTDPHAKPVKELTDKRTANASFFQMSDGSVQEQLSAAPTHYRDAKGVWQDIDASVRPVSHGGFTEGAVGNSFQTYFGSSAADLVRVESGGGFVQVGLDGAKVSAPKVSGNTVTYAGALPGADVVYRTGPDGVDESIVLSGAPAGAASYSFSVKLGGLSPRQLADGAIAFYGSESADPVFVIPAPYMADAKPDVNSPYGFAYSPKVTQTMAVDAVAGVLRVTETPDAAWLAAKDRVYPVTVDPTIVVSSTSSTAANVMILADSPSTNYQSNWRMSVGTTATGAARSLVKFVMPAVPAGTTITSADLRLYYDQTFTTGSNTVPMQALAANAAWNPATATWSNASSIGGAVAGTTSMQANALAVWNDFPVTSTVQGWLNGTLANNGFVLKAANEATLGQGGPRYEKSGYFYGGEVKNYPQLVIRYGVPGVTVNPPTVIHSTGAELSWPAYANTTGNAANDIAEYQVHRSIYETFSPTADTEIAPVSAAQTGFVDSTAVPTPANNADPYGNAYYYMVAVKTKGGQLIPGPTTVVRLPEAGRTTLLIPTQSATTLASAQPTAVLNTLSNAGTPQPWLEVGDNSGTYGTTRSVFNFPALSAVPAGSTVLEAHLKLWQETTTTNTSGAVYQLHALTRPFTGTQATWNAAATGTNWTTPGGDFTATTAGTVSGLTNDPNRQNVDATCIVQGWVNNPASNDGLLIKLAAESSTSPQERTIFAGPATAEPALAPTLVVTYLDTSTESTYYAPSTPTDMNPGTTYTVPVTINNTTASTWAAASEVLTYHWTLPDGTDVTGTSQLQTALPSDLAPAGTVTLNAQVTPPAPTDGNQAEGATLAWDMYNKSTGTYLSAGAGTAPMTAATKQTTSAAGKQTTSAVAAASGGTGSLKQQVSVDPTGNNQLGLEKFYSYINTPTGSGSHLYSNTGSGNSVWNDDLFSYPSVGFNTTLRLSYNSMSTMDTTTGFGWSIEASAPIRLGQGLQFHPQSNPTSVVMVDGTGNAHQWNWNAASNTWTSPPGVHLFLQGTACKPQDSNAQAWKMTRPDRTTYYFDCEGFPTKQIDANGNEADFSYTLRQSENKPEEFLSEITDPMGRTTLSLSYYSKGDAFQYVDSTGALVPATNLTDPAIIDHVKSIRDVSGREIDFYYTSEGLLGQVTDGAGSNVAKTFKFSYDPTQGMKNVKLVAVTDPRGDATGIAYYPTSTATKWWTKTVTDRKGAATGFAYVQPGSGGAATTATVTDANGGVWTYDTDSSARLVEQDDPAIPVNGSPVSPSTKLTWDGDNNVTDLVEHNGAHSHWEYDGNTGYPTKYQDAVSYQAGAATTYQYNNVDTADGTLSGHIADLLSVRSPTGRQWSYTYDTDAAGNVDGNVKTARAPNGNAAGAAAGSYTTTYTYDSLGEVTSVKDANGGTTTYSYTKYIGPGSEQANEPTGQPLTVVDPKSAITSFVYGPRGEVTSATDPTDHTGTRNWDVFLRPLDSQVPKDQAHGVYVISPAPTYDGDDNVTAVTAPYLSGAPVANSTTTTVYDKDDLPSQVSLPANNNTTRQLTYGYDKVGNRTSVTQPKGAAGASPPTYTIQTAYNADNQTASVTQASNTQLQYLYGYDDAGNRTSVTDPRKSVSQTQYDFDHRVIGTIDAANAKTSVTYDLDGFRTSATDQLGDTTKYASDADGQLIQVQVPRDVNTSTTPPTIDYDTTQFKYDQVGNRTAVISPLGVAALADPTTAGSYTVNTEYDAANHVAVQRGAYLAGDPTYGKGVRPETDYSYDADGHVLSVDRIRQPNGFNKLSAPEHSKTTYDYFDNGWTKDSTDPFSIKTAYDYDGQGRQTSRTLTSSDRADATTDPSGSSGAQQRQMTWGYYPDGSLRTSSDTGLPAGWQDQVTTADAANTNTIGTWAAGPAGAGYGGSTYYTGQGTYFWVLSVPQKGTYSVYVYYSKAGSGTADYTFADTQSNTHSLTSVDQTKNVGTWQNIGTISAEAGTNGQAIQLTAEPGAIVVADAVKIVCTDCGGAATGTTQTNSFTYSYDPNGNLSELTDASPNAQFDDYTTSFNELNQLTGLTEKKAGSTVHTLTYGYDASGNLANQTQDGASGTFTYNNLNQLTQVVDNLPATPPLVNQVTTSYAYWPNGQLQKETKGNQNVVSYAYNSNGTLASSKEVTAGGATVDQHLLDYDANNNLFHDTVDLQNAGGGADFTRTTKYLYSPGNQVVSATNGKDDQSYTYDSQGNIDEQTVNGQKIDFSYLRGRLAGASPQASGSTGPTGAYIYDTLGRLETVANGYSYSGSVSQQYLYDGFDNIVSQASNNNTDTYNYDSLNRPVTETINGSQKETIDYLGTSKTVADEVIGGTDTKTYDYSAGGERLALVNSDSANSLGNGTFFYSYNGHGDVEALTGASGSTTGTYGYTAYGSDDPSLDSGSDTGITNPGANFPFNPYRFNAGRVSTATNNLDMGFRTYDPSINAFVSRDSYNGAAADAGLASGSLYGFAGGNPVSNVEADGHSFWSIVGGIAAGAAVIGGCALAGVGTLGVAALACAVGAGLAGGLAAQGVSCAQSGGSACSAGAFATSAGEGVVAGAVAFGVAAVLPEALAGWAAGGIAGAASGAAGYGTGCAVGAECSWTGLAQATAFGGALGAAFGALGSGGGCGQSFSPDTKVRLADGGSKAISELKAGDKVASADTATGKVHGSTASAVLVNHDTDLFDLTVRTGAGAKADTVDKPAKPAKAAQADTVINTTAHHLFFDRTQHRWIEAAKLPKGDELTTDDGATVTVVGGAAPAVSDGDMWDLSVPGDHDFFVTAGDSAVLVHNCPTEEGSQGSAEPAKGSYESLDAAGKASYDTLKAAVERARGDMDAIREQLGPNQRGRTDVEFYLQRMWAGTALEKAVAADPAVLADDNIFHQGASEPGQKVADFVIGGEYNVDVTGDSATSIREHQGRDYYDHSDQIMTYPSLTGADIAKIFKEGD